jgi:hypothetical protein
MWRPTVRVGCVAVLAAIVGLLGTKYWVESRTLRAVDIPVSLARGIITADFDVNVHAFYSINIGLSQGDDPNLVCSNGTVLETRRISSLGDLSVYRYQWLDDANRRTGRDAIAGSFLGGFESRRGHHTLRIEVLSDTACLNEREPRLYVVASNVDFNRWIGYYDSAFWISLVAASIGLGILIVGVRESLRRPLADDSDLRFCEPETTRTTRRYSGRERVKAAPWIPFFSQVGLLYSQILLLVCLCAIPTFHYAWGGGMSYGFFVLTSFPESSLFRHLPCAQAWVVRVKSNGVWYLNTKRIEPDQLSATLRAEIGAKASCVVSLDAEPDVPFSEAIHAIELIEQSPGRVVLLTLQAKRVRIP